MARDKKETLKKIVSAARSEFQKMGFEKASIRKIASDAGLTSAALYRHFSSKEEIFSYLVDPGIKAMRQWMEMHEKTSYEMIDLGNIDEAKSESSIDMIKEVVFPHLDAFKLLLCSAQGTKYENFIHETVEEHQKGLRRGLEYLKDKGYPVMDISDETLHMLMSAYLTALFEPIVHDYPKKDAASYLETINKFFMPGWQRIMGIEET